MHWEQILRNHELRQELQDEPINIEKQIIRRGRPTRVRVKSPKLREKFSLYANEFGKTFPTRLNPKNDPTVKQISRVADSLKSKRVHQIVAAMLMASGMGLMTLPALQHHMPGSLGHVNAPTLPAKPGVCGFQNPMLVETALGTFYETDSAMCARILQAVPAPSRNFTQYNKNIGIRALQDGSFQFRIFTFKAESESLDQMIKDHPKGSIFGSGNIRQAYMDSYSFVTYDNNETTADNFNLVDRYISAERSRRAGHSFSQHDLESGNSAGAQRALNFRQRNPMDSYGIRPISAENYRAVIGAWLISPLPFAFYLAEWNKESGLRSGAQSDTSSARGINQFTIATFLYAVKKYGRQVGLPDLHAQVMTLSTYKNSKGKIVSRNDADTVKDPRFIALFRQASINPNYSTALGVLNTASKIEKLQADVDNGTVRLPNGRTKITEIEGYMAHYLGANVIRLLKARVEHPNAFMINVLSHRDYERNEDDFRNITVEDYFAKIARKNGFGNKTLDVSHWFQDGHGRNFATNVNPREMVRHDDIGTKFRIVANDSTARNILSVQTRPNVSWIQTRYIGKDIEPITPQPARSPS